MEIPPSVTSLTVVEDNAGQRIDNFLFRICKGVPKSHIYRVLRSGEVRVNKHRIDQTYQLIEGDIIRIPPMRIAVKKIHTVSKIKFKVLFEDNCLLIIDKPAGIAVHGGSSISHGGVIECLRANQSSQSSFLELVHRLDRDTSGILLIAKKRYALKNLHEQMRDGKTDKRYLVLVFGGWKNERQHIKLPLHKYISAEGERRVRVQADGKASHTIFNLIHRYKDYTLLEAELKTGRTHQIRVHLSSNGFAIVGDDKYGNFVLNRILQKKGEFQTSFKRMFLHAHQISFTHPESGELVTITSPMPSECSEFLKILSKDHTEKQT